MDRAKLISLIHQRNSFLCVGLDPDFGKIPAHILEMEDPIFEFNKAIIDATREHCVAYKPNLAFYECHGAKGWQAFEKTVEYIGKEHFIIADAKRGDIGNTSTKYADAFFKQTACDAVTIAPYMGEDSVKPFIGYDGKWAILLALTSNKGADDFQFSKNQETGERLFEEVLRKSCEWGSADNLMFVVGATRPEYFEAIRAIAPDHFLLVPGVGAQGGSLSEVVKYGMNKDLGLLVNASRSIMYASNGLDFAEKAGEEAARIALEMKTILLEKNVF